MPSRDVTFRWPDGPEVVVDVHLTGYVGATIHHGTRLAHDGAGLHAVTLQLPDDACVSYGFRVSPAPEHPDVPLRELTDHLRPDPDNPDRVVGAFGSLGSTSVLELAGSRRHPWWVPSYERTPEAQARCQRLRGGGRDLFVVQGEPTLPALVVLDGDLWAREDFGFLHAWRRYQEQSPDRCPSLVLVATPDREVLAERQAMIAILGEGVLARHVLSAVPGLGERGVIVAGQSYGGLAAAGLLIDLPDVVRGAVLQSGSYWFGARDEDADPVHPDAWGTVIHDLRALAPSARTQQVVVQAGTTEGAMLGLSYAFGEAARSAGVTTTVEEFSGGHDYAWYRHGLLFGIEFLLRRRAT